MGMAASQARYLGLTARKTNVEYEGQQINQARTALANQSANLFNQMLTMEVPTAPSTTEFTTVQYSYKDGVYGETIDEMYELSDQADGYNWLVTHHHNADVYTGIKEVITNPEVYGAVADVYASTPSTITTANFTYNGTPVPPTLTANGNNYTYVSVAALTPEQKAYFDASDMGKLTTPPTNVFMYKDPVTGNISFVDAASDFTNDIAEEEVAMTPDVFTPAKVGNSDLALYDATDATQAAALRQIRSDWPEIAGVPDDQIYVYEDLGKTYFTTKANLEESYNEQQDTRFLQENQVRLDTYRAEALNTKITETERARVQVNGEGRWENVQFENSSAIYTLTTETKTDENAYNAAMNQYVHDVALYEKAVQDINAKTEIIQAEDRTLELRLKQLDTEQKALQTEMEAVAKVIQKNVETTFKTFNS